MDYFNKIPQRSQRPVTSFDFNGFSLGLNTSVRPHQILPNECAELVNFKLNRGGQLQTRPAFVKHTSTAVAAIKAHAYVNIAGTNRELIVDSDKKLYYNNAGTPTRIGGTLLLSSNAVDIVGYKGVAIFCDGSYLKYANGVGATNLKICYDNGSGARGYQSTNLTGTNDTSLAVGNGTTTRVAYKFTSQAWDSGYTIPPTTIEAYLTKTGSPTGTVTAKLRAVSGDAELATGTIVSAANLTGTAEKYTATLTVTTEMSPATAYYATIEYAGGDGSNYVNVHCTTVASAGLGYTYAPSTYTQDATKTPLMGVKPGRPPKAQFGEVHKQRLFVSGDTDYPGYVWYGNLTYLDWSTSSGGGYIGVVDADSVVFSVGGMKSIYGDLVVFGTTNRPFMCKLSGSSPTDWTLPAIGQRQSTTFKTLVSSVNDLWWASKEGVDSLAGVQEYGDLRTFSYSDPVRDRIEDYFSTSTALAGYNPIDGQYMLVMPTYHRVLVCHTKLQEAIFNSSIRYPWAEYEFTREHLTNLEVFKWTASASGTNEFYVEAIAGGTPGITLTPDFLLLNGVKMVEGTAAGVLNDHEYKYADNDTLGYSTIYFRDDTGTPQTSGVDLRTVFLPTSFAAFGGVFYIGSTDGFIYEYSASGYKDNTAYHMRYDLRTQYTQSKYAHLHLTNQQINAGSQIGGLFTLNIYTDDQFLTPTASYDYVLSVADDLILDDALTQLNDANYSIDPVGNPLFIEMDVIARNFQTQITDVIPAGQPIFINGLSYKLRMLEV